MMNEELGKMKTNKNYIKDQINVHVCKKILDISKDNKYVLNFSFKGETFDFIKLKEL